MLDPVAMKNAALVACLKPLGDYLDTMGFERPLAGYSREEILGLVDVIVVAYQDHMRLQYENAVASERNVRGETSHGR